MHDHFRAASHMAFVVDDLTRTCRQAPPWCLLVFESPASEFDGVANEFEYARLVPNGMQDGYKELYWFELNVTTSSSGYSCSCIGLQ